jgi:hypothetical protein
MRQFAIQWRAMRRLARVVLVTVAVLAAGCSSLPLPLAPQPPADQPVPTVNPMFVPRAGPAELTASTVISGTLTRAQILHNLLVEPTSAATRQPGQKIVDEPIFDDSLNADWTTDQSSGVQSAFTDLKHAYTGNVGIEVTPQEDFGTLFFTVEKGAKETYGLDRVLGVSVWINSGDQPLNPNDLSITVVGSNDYTYWVPGDKSVATDSTHFFSESRLYYLGVKNTVPPNTWVEAVVRLDKLPYEPDYKYVTGIYIKNDEWFRRTFYIDQVHLLVVK